MDFKMRSLVSLVQACPNTHMFVQFFSTFSCSIFRLWQLVISTAEILFIYQHVAPLEKKPQPDSCNIDF